MTPFLHILAAHAVAFAVAEALAIVFAVGLWGWAAARRDAMDGYGDGE